MADPKGPQVELPPELLEELGAESPAAEEESAAEAAASDDVAELRRQLEEQTNKYLRLAAEFDNFRKRNERDWQDHRRRSTAEVLRAVLTSVDNLDRALQTAPEDGAGLRAGVELIRTQLLTTLQGFGVAPIEAKGRPFDPAQHEAVLLVDAPGVDAEYVVDVVQSGYTLHGEVLRPARVTVSR